MISDKSRDYEAVLSALYTVKSKNINLTLLGRPLGKYGDLMIKKYQELNNLQLKYYTQFIDQENFDRVMRNTDFLILPMVQHMRFGVVTEQNGFSCVSGNINDMLRFGLPAIIPNFYPLEPHLEFMVERYKDSSQLAELVDKWSSRKSYNKIKQEIIKSGLPENNKLNMSQHFLQSLKSVQSEVLNRT